jgi:glycosyltransferase involved in cell wall biosynthesis
VTAAAVPPHVAHVGFFSDPQGRTGRQLLAAWPTLADVAEAAARAGARVSLVQTCAHPERFSAGGVDYHFGPAPHDERLRALAPDLLHVHGLGFHREVRSLAARLPDVPILLQDHASQPPRAWQRAAWRRGLSPAAAIAFCALDQAAPFARAGLFSAHTLVCEVPESTSGFCPGDQQAARRATGVHGDPALLWVGHLDDNKDPLTVLDAVSAASVALPRLTLTCCFGVAPRLREVTLRIAGDERLRPRVRLLGSVPHSDVEQLMRAADFFVLGSHREGSGYALIEALACGLPPAVTDIPSFRALTDRGTVGRLWPCGSAPALRTAIEQLAAVRSSAQRAAVRAHFERELSRAALGRKLLALYARIRQTSRAGGAAPAAAARFVLL